MPVSQVYQLFPISVYRSNMTFTENEVNNILSLDYERMYSDNGNISKHKYILETPEFTEIKKQILKHCDVYTKSYMNVQKDIEFYLQNSWVVQHKPGDWAQTHVHANSLLSGVCYIQTDEQSGDIKFHKPDGYTNTFHSCVNIDYEKMDTHNCDEYNLTPKIGEILLFPAHLMHSVKPNNSFKDRYSLSFNFYAKGELYSRTSDIDYLNLRNGNRYDES